MPRFFLPVCSAVILLSCVDSVPAQEWTRFRGPNGSGISHATTVPATWTEDDYNWTADLPGEGISAPVVWGDRLFLTSADVESSKRYLVCVDTRSGNIVWTKESELEAYKKHKNNSFAASTPCVDKDHVYVAWLAKSESSLNAFRHDGTPVWSYDMGPYLHGQGGATSPIVYDDMVVIANDQKQPSYLLAVDRATGKERWKVPREGKRACYGTPCVFVPDDRPAELIFTHCYEGVVGIDPKSGTQNWHIDVFGRASQRALGSPILADDLVIATSGAGAGERQLVAIRTTHSNGEVTASEAFRTNKQTPHVPTPLVFDDWLFVVSDQGIASCLDKTTGETVWKERLGGNYFGSPVCVGGNIYCIDLDGRVVVFAASDSFTLHGKMDLGEGSKSTPAVSDGVMYLRTASKLFSLGG